METTVKIINDELELEIPNELVKKLDLHPGDTLDVSVDGDKIIFRPKRLRGVDKRKFR